MALQGTLQDFGVLETFQLIALQHKTGTLEIRNTGQVHAFVFENGLLLSAHGSELKEDDLLVRFLVEAGYVQTKEITPWLTFPSSQPINPIDPLAKLTDMSAEDVVMAYDLYVQTVLDEILSWPRGRFQFHSGRVGTPSKLVGPWKIEGLLMESMRRLDELADLQAVDLSPGLIPKIGDPQAARFMEDPYARAVLARIDGRRSVEEIINASALAGYDLCQTFRQLRDQELITMVEWIPSGPWMGTAWRQRSRWMTVLYSVSGTAALFGLSFAIHAILDHCANPWPHTSGFAFISPAGAASRATFAAAEAMEVYRLESGRYPADPAALLEHGLLDRACAEILESEGLTWHLAADGQTYDWFVFPEQQSETPQEIDGGGQVVDDGDLR